MPPRPAPLAAIGHRLTAEKEMIGEFEIKVLNDEGNLVELEELASVPEGEGQDMYVVDSSVPGEVPL